jgi:cob(I)alamin adenosyltransferase
MGAVREGKVQVYTGDGKGKTTAALGLALRAVGAGFKVYVAQFVKGSEYSELKALKRLSDAVTVRQYGLGFFVGREPGEADVAAAREGLREVREIMTSGTHDLVILDEAAIATHYHLFSVEALIAAVRARADHVEVVITGRRADPRVVEAADLVTEMREVKHYYQAGVMARVGIEK